MENIGGMTLDKRKTGINLGILSIFPVIASVITLFILKGPGTNIYLVSFIIGVLSLVGIILAIVSSIKSKRIRTGLIGFIANVCFLFYAFLLLLAMGISEP